MSHDDNPEATFFAVFTLPMQMRIRVIADTGTVEFSAKVLGESPQSMSLGVEEDNTIVTTLGMAANEELMQRALHTMSSVIMQAVKAKHTKPEVLAPTQPTGEA